MFYIDHDQWAKSFWCRGGNAVIGYSLYLFCLDVGGVVVLLEVCPECYSRYFPVYPNMKIKISSKRHKCSGCGKNRRTVREVWVDGKLIDIN